MEHLLEKGFKEIQRNIWYSLQRKRFIVIENPSLQDKTYYEWMISQRGHTEKEIVMKTIDDLVEKVLDYSQFKTCLQNLGYSVEDDLTEERPEKFQFTANRSYFRKRQRNSFFQNSIQKRNDADSKVSSWVAEWK